MEVTMKAWRVQALGSPVQLVAVDKPETRPGTVLVRMAASPLLSYLKRYATGTMAYGYPPAPFTLGTNGSGTVAGVGSDVYHVKVGERVVVHPHLVANEPVDVPPQILIGLTAISPDSGPMIATWRDGTLAEYTLMPASAVVPLTGLEQLPLERLAALGKFIVPLGGLMRGRLIAGETLVVNGGSGYFGSAAVLLGLAMGAERVVAAGRRESPLQELVDLGGGRVSKVVLTGDVRQDSAKLSAAAGGGAHLAFDQVGGATDPNATIAVLRSLKRGGRLVLMGSMSTPVPIDYGEVMINNWEIIGNFMYPADAYPLALRLVRAGLLNLDAVRIRLFPFSELPAAMDAAERMQGLECTVLSLAPSGEQFAKVRGPGT
jgi:alcohol dehydrogenase